VLTSQIIIRQYKNLFVKNINIILITKTLEILPSSILDDNKHYLEQELFMDHRNQLILLITIIQKYIDIFIFINILFYILFF